MDPLEMADRVTLVACMDNSNATDASSGAKECAGDGFAAAKTCHDGNQGLALLTAASTRYKEAIAGEAHAFIPDVFIDGKHQIPVYTYDRLKPAICAAGSTASIC